MRRDGRSGVIANPAARRNRLSGKGLRPRRGFAHGAPRSRAVATPQVQLYFNREFGRPRGRHLRSGVCKFRAILHSPGASCRSYDGCALCMIRHVRRQRGLIACVTTLVTSAEKPAS